MELKDYIFVGVIGISLLIGVIDAFIPSTHTNDVERPDVVQGFGS